MNDLLKKLDEIMTSDQVRKLGGLFCLVILVITAAAFLIGAGSILKSMKGPAVEVTEEEGAGAEEEATDEDLEEEAEDEAEEEAEE